MRTHCCTRAFAAFLACGALASAALAQADAQKLRVGLIGFNSAELRQGYEANFPAQQWTCWMTSLGCNRLTG